MDPDGSDDSYLTSECGRKTAMPADNNVAHASHHNGEEEEGQPDAIFSSVGINTKSANANDDEEISTITKPTSFRTDAKDSGDSSNIPSMGAFFSRYTPFKASEDKNNYSANTGMDTKQHTTTTSACETTRDYDEQTPTSSRKVPMHGSSLGKDGGLIDQSHVVSSSTTYFRKQARTIAPFVVIAIEIIFDIANTIWYFVRTQDAFVQYYDGDLLADDDWVAVKYWRDYQFMGIYYLFRCAITIGLTAIGLFAGKWRKVGVSPLNADWGAETYKGLVARTVLAFVFILSIAFCTNLVFALFDLYSVMITSYIIAGLLLVLLVTLFVVKTRIKDAALRDERFVSINRMLAFLWEAHNSAVDLINSIYFSDSASISIILLVLDITRVLYEIVADYMAWNISYFEGSIFVNAKTPERKVLQMYRSEPVTVDSTKKIVLQYSGTHTSTIIKGLSRHALQLQKCKKICTPDWLKILEGDSDPNENGIPVVLSIRRLFDPEYIYEENNQVFFHVEPSFDMMMEGSDFSRQIHVERDQKAVVSRPLLLH